MATYLSVYLGNSSGLEEEKIRVPDPAGIQADGTITDSHTVIANATAIAQAAKATVTGGGTVCVTNSGSDVDKYRAQVEVSYTLDVPNISQLIPIP